MASLKGEFTYRNDGMVPIFMAGEPCKHRCQDSKHLSTQKFVVYTRILMHQSEHHMGLGKHRASPPGIIRTPFTRVQKFVVENVMRKIHFEKSL